MLIYSILFALMNVVRRLGFLGFIVLVVISVFFNIFFKGSTFIKIQIVYYALSAIFLVIAFILACFGQLFVSTSDKLLKKYYGAVTWPEACFLYCYYYFLFARLNFVFSIALCIKSGIWYPIVISVVYLLFAFYLMPRLQPFIWLAHQESQGNKKAGFELMMLDMLKNTMHLKQEEDKIKSERDNLMK